MDWVTLPKVELHLHLDTSLNFEAAVQLKPSLTREVFLRDYVAPEKCLNLADFLSRVPRILELLQTERGLQLLTQEMFRQLADDHMLYAELRFAPLLHTQQGLAPKDIVRIIEAAADKGSKATGIETRLILCSLRHFSADQSMETVQLVDQFKGSRVAAFDLAGDEAGYPLATHLEAFRFAKDRHIAITSHAGEASGAQSVWETLDQVQPDRLGHGVRSIEDPALVARLKQMQIHLEMCPTCNVQLEVFPTYPEHCIDRLYREGLSLGISTDNRTLTPVTLTREYEKMAATFGWGKQDFQKCNVNALNAAFVPQPIKDDLLRRLNAAYDRA
ncbi:MAG: adenosine deaminase [Anaerolineae bacterium]|nr:adenosine deaminase [Anaerolineae bacterium]